MAAQESRLRVEEASHGAPVKGALSAVAGVGSRHPACACTASSGRNRPGCRAGLAQRPHDRTELKRGQRCAGVTEGHQLCVSEEGRLQGVGRQDGPAAARGSSVRHARVCGGAGAKVSGVPATDPVTKTRVYLL